MKAKNSWGKIGNLVTSRGPFHDKLRSYHGGEVVLYYDETEIDLLTFESNEWHIHGHLSIIEACGLEHPDADFYYRGNAYLIEQSRTYACLNNNSSIIMWSRVYQGLGQLHCGRCLIPPSRACMRCICGRI